MCFESLYTMLFYFSVDYNRYKSLVCIFNSLELHHYNISHSLSLRKFYEPGKKDSESYERYSKDLIDVCIQSCMNTVT